MATDLLKGRINEVLEMRKKGASFKEIAERFDCSATYISKRIKEAKAQPAKETASKKKVTKAKSLSTKEVVEEDSIPKIVIKKRSSGNFDVKPNVFSVTDFFKEKRIDWKGDNGDPLNGDVEQMQHNMSCGYLLRKNKNDEVTGMLGYLIVNHTEEKRAIKIYISTSIEKDYVSEQKQMLAKLIETYSPTLLYGSETGLTKEQLELFGFSSLHVNTNPAEWLNGIEL